MFGRKSRKIKELQKENAVLKDKIGMLEKANAKLYEEVEDVKRKLNTQLEEWTLDKKELKDLQDRERQRFQARSEASKKAAKTKKKNSKK